jgi:hypothetical protein
MQLLNGINQQMNVGDPLRAAFTRHAVSALLSQPVFAAAAGSLLPGNHQFRDACEVLLDGVAKRATRGVVSVFDQRSQQSLYYQMTQQSMACLVLLNSKLFFDLHK